MNNRDPRQTFQRILGDTHINTVDFYVCQTEEIKATNTEIKEKERNNVTHYRGHITIYLRYVDPQLRD